MAPYRLKSEEAIGRLWSSPIREHLDGFAAELRARGCPRRSGQLLLRGAAHLGHWALARRLPLERITPDVLASFLDHIPTCTCTHLLRGRREYDRSGGRRLVEYSRQVGALPLVPAPSLPPLIERFAEWMRLHRGVTASTLACDIQVPEGPGLGVEVDEEAIERYRRQDDEPTPRQRYRARKRILRVVWPAGPRRRRVREFADEAEYQKEFYNGSIPRFQRGVHLEVEEDDGSPAFRKEHARTAAREATVAYNRPWRTGPRLTGGIQTNSRER